MKKSLHIFSLLLILSVISCINIYAQDVSVIPVPNPPRLVTDLTQTLSTEDLQRLEAKLVAIDDSSSNQIAVVIIPTLNGYPIEDYALSLLRKWGIGNKKTNNGVLLLVAKNDRKVRIEIGGGLEGAIPDITAKAIIDNDIVPYFRVGNFYGGIDAATNSIAKAAVGEYKTAKQKGVKGKKISLLTIFIIIVVIILLISVMSGGNNDKGGGMVSRRGYGDFVPPIWINSGSRGSSWGSGSSGGFGGFGGGSGFGGGASGSW